MVQSMENKIMGGEYLEHSLIYRVFKKLLQEKIVSITVVVCWCSGKLRFDSQVVTPEKLFRSNLVYPTNLMSN